MTTNNPCLNINGNDDVASNYYKEIFQLTFPLDQNYPKTFYKSNSTLAIDMLNLGKTFLNGLGKLKIEGEMISLSISSHLTRQAEELFSNLSTGGEIRVPLSKTEWGTHFGMLHDKFGISWMFNCSYEEDLQN